MSPYHAKKRLGQHFLKSDAIVAKIVELADLHPGDTVVEIGPGRGRLTLPLAESGAQVVAVEFDRDLQGYLTRLLSKYDNVRILHADFLTLDPAAHGLEKFTLIGNIPYNITSPVMAWCAEHRHSLHKSVLMVQKEMAERIAGEPGSKNWSPLAISTQVWCDVRICFEVAARHFSPPPAVTSAVIELKPHDRRLEAPYHEWEPIVRAAFRQRRKLLVNNLVPDVVADTAVAHQLLAKLDIPLTVRAEQMTIQQFVALARAIAVTSSGDPRK